MLLIILFILILLILLLAFFVYYNYIARFHRIHLYGKLMERFPSEDWITPAFKIDKRLLKKNELEKYQLLVLRHLPLVVCLGDSITHGIISMTYVESLQQKYMGRYLFINAGINGNLAYNLNRRLKYDCLDFKPDFVTILIGTNDVNSLRNESVMKNYIKFQKLPMRPDENFFKKNLEEIIFRIKSETQAKIAIMSLPLIGEDLDSDINLKIFQYSAIIKELALKYKLAYLPLNEIQRKYLAEIKNRHPATYMKKNMLRIISLMINRSFDRIAELNGYYLTYDGLHATSRGARMIEYLVSLFLEGKKVNVDTPVLSKF
jgi:lysophospholipase L1-like esterase